jgi:deoxyribonuclease-4
VSRIAASVREVLDRTSRAVMVLEVTAGQGDHVGYTFEQIGAIIEETGNHGRVGACIDTCHAFAAGYDFSSDQAYDALVTAFDSAVGLDRLRGMHINDSMTALGSRRDRHALLGRGEIGIPAIARFVTDPRIPDVPFVLETPEPEIWAKEIALLRGFAEGKRDPSRSRPPRLPSRKSDKKKKGDNPG